MQRNVGLLMPKKNIFTFLFLVMDRVVNAAPSRKRREYYFHVKGSQKFVQFGICTLEIAGTCRVIEIKGLKIVK